MIHCHHQNDSRIQMGSDENHLNFSLTVRDKVTRQCPQTTTFEEEGDPKRIRTEVPLLTSLGLKGGTYFDSLDFYVYDTLRINPRPTDCSLLSYATSTAHDDLIGTTKHRQKKRKRISNCSFHQLIHLGGINNLGETATRLQSLCRVSGIIPYEAR